MSNKPHGHAATKQHFLPRCLLRGFSIHKGKKQHYLYEFRNNGIVRWGEVGTVGHQRRFYGSDSLEAKLADRETRFANLLQSLRTDSVNVTMKPQIDEFVSHMLVRTNNLRTGLVEMGNAMLDGMREQFERAESGSRLHNLILQGTQSDETREAIEREAEKLPEAVRPLYRETIKSMMQSPQVLELIKAIASQAFPMIDIPQSVRNAQTQVLEAEKVQERAKLLQPFTWRLLEYEPNTLVLGDHGPLGRERGHTSMRNLMFMEGITEVFLPVSHQRLLLGDLDGSTMRPDPEQVNLNSVELSYELFVARTDSPRERSYLSLIGRRARLFDPQELRNLIEEGLKNDA